MTQYETIKAKIKKILINKKNPTNISSLCKQISNEAGNNLNHLKVKTIIYQMAKDKDIIIGPNFEKVHIKDTNETDQTKIKRMANNYEDDFSSPFTIKCESKSYTWTPWQITSLVEEGEIIWPHYQRKFKWNNKQASAFIESLIFGIPVPTIFVYKNKKNKFEIIDGQQRIITLKTFMKGEKLPGYSTEFKLTNNVVEPLQNKSFIEKSKNSKVLDEDSKFKLKHYPINVTEFITNEDKPAMLFQIFSRLNSSGTPLNSDEIRMALYSSSFYNEIIKISESPKWLCHFKSKEIVNANPFGWLLRCLMIYCFYDFQSTLENPNNLNKNLKLQEELNAFSEIVKTLSNSPDKTPNNLIKDYKDHWIFKYFSNTKRFPDTKDIIPYLKKICNKSIQNIHKNFSDGNAFVGKQRDSKELSKSKKRIIADTLFIIANNDNINTIENEKLLDSRKTAVLSDDFEATTTSSTKVSNIIKRIDIFKKHILNEE